MGSLMQNAALFMPDTGVWHMDCVVALSFIPRKVCFRELRLTSVKWDLKKPMCSVEFTNTKLAQKTPDTLTLLKSI